MCFMFIKRTLLFPSRGKHTTGFIFNALLELPCKMNSTFFALIVDRHMLIDGFWVGLIERISPSRTYGCPKFTSQC